MWPYGTPLAWTAIAYGTWMYFTDEWKRSVVDIGPLWLAHTIRAIAKAAMSALGVTWDYELSGSVSKVRSSIGNQGAIGCIGPHGAYSIAALFLGVPSFRCDSELRDLKVSIIGASVLFYVPFVREYLLLFGVREATVPTTKLLLHAGRIVALCPGGIYEQVHTEHNQEKVFAQKRLGFLRLALELHVPILVMYGFGENQLYTHSSTLLEWRRWVALKYRVGLPWMTGRWGLGLGPIPLLPHPTNVVHVLSPAIHLSRNQGSEVEGKSELISEEDVTKAWAAYRKGLCSLFDAHKDDKLPPEVAARGLIIKWLGEK